LAGTDHAVVSTAGGEFTLAGLPPGRRQLNVHKLGFAPIEAWIDLAPSRTLFVDLELLATRSLARLDTVRVRAESVHVGTMKGVYERKATSAGGVFILGAELDSARGTLLPMLIAKRVRGTKIITYEANSALLLASGRGITSLTKLPRADPQSPSSPAACYSAIYLDGVRLYSPGDGIPVPDLSRYDIGSLAAVEFYPGPATTPLEYGGTGANCGTLLLWTKAR
jgi:hypothetical protein